VAILCTAELLGATSIPRDLQHRLSEHHRESRSLLAEFAIYTFSIDTIEPRAVTAIAVRLAT